MSRTAVKVENGALSQIALLAANAQNQIETTGLVDPTTQSIDNPNADVLADGKNNSLQVAVKQTSPTTATDSDGNMYQLKGDQWFPIIVNIPDNTPGTTDPNNTPLTEDEKRKRTIMIFSIVLLVMIVLVAYVSLKKR